MTTIISLMWGNAYDRYGKNFVDTLDQYWPADVDLVVVSDRPLELPRGRVVPLARAVGLAECQARWRNDRRANGLGITGVRKVDPNGKSWRHDAVKWAPQGFAPEVAVADLPDGEVVAWFDADVVTFKPVPKGFVEGILGDADLCHLGRKASHSEIGFWAMRLSPATRAFAADFAEMYRSDKCFELTEWHSAFVFDHCLGALRAAGGDVKNLTPGQHGHVWFSEPTLSSCTDHLKGARKKIGHSAERRQ